PDPASAPNRGARRPVPRGAEDREIRRSPRRLSADVGKVSRPLGVAIETMARLDFITARARFSRDHDMAPPDINTEGRLWLRGARHPLLEHLFRVEGGGWRVEGEDGSKGGLSSPSTLHPPTSTREVVPIDVRLGHGFNLLIITGPNTGGKTVTLKTTGLLCLMAQSGMHIPAGQGSLVPVFHQILADIGDEQSLEQSLSTFS